MLSYSEFILESIDSTIPYYYSEKFRSFLNNIVSKKKPGFEISKLLLDAEQSNQVSDDITFIDMTESNDKVSFIQLNRIKRMYDNHLKEIENSEEKIVPISFQKWVEKIALSEDSDPWKNQRTDLFIGRFVNRVSQKSKISLDPSELEKFVNTYKSEFELGKSGESMFEIVNGEGIKHWYLEDHYEISRGQLGNSCMRYKHCQEYFDIYVKNPEVCQLLILRSSNNYDKITGRALIWKLTNGKTYMDRVYTIRDSDANLFYEYAKKREWLREDDLDSSTYIKMQVKLKEWRFDEYPYMDTFRCLNVSKGVLYSDEDIWGEPEIRRLTDTRGGYDSDNMIYSEYHDEYIDRNDAVQTIHGDWIRSDSAIYLEYKGGYVPSDEDTCLSEYDGKVYYSEDVHFSDIMDDYIYHRDSIEIIINSTGQTDYIHKDFLKDLIEVEYDDELVSTLPQFTIFNPIDKKYYFKDDVIDEQDVMDTIIKSNQLLPWEEVVEQILDSDFDLDSDTIKLPGGREKIIALTDFRRGRMRFDLLSPKPKGLYTRKELNNIIKCFLIISPSKEEKKRWRTTTDIESFNKMMYNIYQTNDRLKDMLPKSFWGTANFHPWFIKAVISLSDEFVADVLKDPRAIATWYSIKMPF